MTERVAGVTGGRVASRAIPGHAISLRTHAGRVRADTNGRPAVTPEPTSPRHNFRILTRTRTGYDGAVMYDVQLQVVSTGALIWAQTFSDEQEAEEYRAEVEDDLNDLDDAEFRRRWSVPSSA